MESHAGDRSRVLTGGERSRKRKRTVIDAAVCDRSIKVGGDRDRWRNVELKTSHAHSVAVLIIAIDAVPHIQTRKAKAITRALPNSAGAAHAFTKQRQAATVKPKLKM